MYSSIISLTLALDGVRGQAKFQPLYHQERDPAPIVQEAVWAPELVWIGAENFALTEIGSPDRPDGAIRYTDHAILAHTCI
jgi:hypothetical protein